MKRLVLFCALALGALAMLAAACGDGGDGDSNGNGQSDPAAIEQLVRDLAGALEALDADRMAGLFSQECTGIAEQANQQLSLFEGADFEFQIDAVEIQDRTEDTAEARPVGSVTFDGEEEQLVDEEFTNVVKEDGEWRIADCDFFE